MQQSCVALLQDNTLQSASSATSCVICHPGI